MTDAGIRRLALGTLLGVLPGSSLPEPAGRLLADGLAGFTLFARNIVDPAQLRELTDAARAVRPDVLLAVDEEGGDITRLAHATGSPYPGNAALGVVDSPVLTRQIYRAIGADLVTAGINLNLAPTVDVNTVDHGGVIGTRSFGVDPALVTVHATAAVLGLQEVGVAACCKHYPGHGATSADSHVSLPTVDAPVRLLRRRDLPPFAAAVGAGVKAIMTAHIRVPELTGPDPATFSPAAIGLLRREYEFDGVVLTDALEMAGAAATAGGVGQAAVRALAAGADLLCVGPRVDLAGLHRLVDEVVAAVTAGRLPVARLEQAAARTAALAAWASGRGATRPPGPDRPTGVPGPGWPAQLPGFDRPTGLPNPNWPTQLPGFDRPTGLPNPHWPTQLGRVAARRSVRVEGSLAGLTDPLVVQLRSGHRIVEGGVPWGLAAHLGEDAVLRLDPATTAPERLRRLAGARPVVLVGRNLGGSAAATALIDELAAGHPCVVVEMGWPGRWRPAGARAFIATHGASRAHGAVLAELLGLAGSTE